MFYGAPLRSILCCFLQIALVLLLVIPFSSSFAEDGSDYRIKVGFILPMTGPAADFGVAMKNAIGLAMEHEKDAARLIQPIIEDAQYEVKNAVHALLSLRNVAKVDVVVVWGLGQCRAVAPVAEKLNIPLIAICLAPEVARSRANVLRFQSSSDDYMKATTDWLSGSGVKRIGVLLSENGYTEEMFSALERSLNPEQTITVIDRVPAVGHEFYAQVLKMRAVNFDAFGLFLAVGQAGTFARQMKTVLKQPIVFGTNVFRSESEIVSAEGGLEGALVSDIRLDKVFLDRYVAQFKSEAQLGFAALAYEVVRLFSIHNSPVPPQESLGHAVFKRIVSSGMQRASVVGDYLITESPEEGYHAQFDLGMMQVKGRGFQFIPVQK
jgi:branched-chain amino acid transport system substrate-binding protein